MEEGEAWQTTIKEGEMNSEVLRDGKKHRPSWNHNTKTGSSYESCQLEMLESIRNVCEDLRAELQTLNRVFACHNFQNIPARLKRISANTYQAKHGKRPPEGKL